jgi:CubicO group peptidase (beta-lactamase class C family)
MRPSLVRSCLSLLCLAGQTAGAQQGATPVPPSRAVLVARLDSLVQDFITDAPAAGITAAVVRGSDTLLLRGVGERDRDRHLPATTATVYRVGSITKQFTSAAVMRLVEQGRISLTDPVTKYLPEYPQWSGITIRQLLNHTSGIHSYTASSEWQKHWAEDMTPAQLIGFVTSDSLDFAPGTRWRYNNTGYMLLGLVLEKVTGRPYAALIDESMFRPLGMRTAAYCPSRPSDSLYSAGYKFDNGKLAPATYLSMTHPYAAGALCMSVPDYLRWQTALTSGGVVSPATYALMSTSDSAGGRPTRYGFGLAPGMMGTHRLVAHSGGVNGFATQQVWFPDDSLRVVVFSNTETSNPDRLAANLAGAVFGLPLIRKPTLPPIVALPAAERDHFVGTYDFVTPTGGKFTVRMFVEGDALMSQAEGPGQGKFPLMYFGANTFGAAFDPSLRLTFTVVDGRATKLLLLQGGQTMEGARRP